MLFTLRLRLASPGPAQERPAAAPPWLARAFLLNHDCARRLQGPPKNARRPRPHWFARAVSRIRAILRGDSKVRPRTLGGRFPLARSRCFFVVCDCARRLQGPAKNARRPRPPGSLALVCVICAIARALSRAHPRSPGGRALLAHSRWFSLMNDSARCLQGLRKNAWRPRPLARSR